MKKKVNVNESLYWYLGADRFIQEDESFVSSDDAWDRPNTDSSWTFEDYCAIGERAPESFPYNSLYYPYEKEMNVKKGDTVFFVVPVWSTGDSFGWDGDYYAEIFGVFLDEKEADDFANQLNNANGYTPIINFNGEERKIYIPWNGYFESLSYINVVRATVTLTQTPL